MEHWKLHIAKEQHEQINEHAESVYPDECCGFMFGRFEEDDNEKTPRTVTEIRPVSNAKTGDKSRRFQIDPIDYQKAEEYAQKKDLDLIGVYHSHPDHPARPSEHDLKQALPVFSYVIVSVKEGVAREMTSWRLDDEHDFKEEKILENIAQTS